MPSSPPPAVSVLMTVFNGEAYLAEALESVLNQTFADFELVVVDDGSTDGSRSILHTLAARDARVVVLENERNCGIPAALNRGLAMCRGPLTARADADDLNAHCRLELQVLFLKTHPEVGLLGTAYHRIDEGGRRLNTRHPPEEDSLIRFRQMFMNSFLHSSVMFRTELVRAVGGYDERYWTAQDSDLWARLRAHTRMANLPQPLVCYRVHAASTMKRRGPEGLDLSLSVPRRLISEYLRQRMDPADTRAMVTLFQGFEPMETEEISRGLLLLHRVLRRATFIEAPRTIAYYKCAMGKALLRQCEYQLAQGRNATSLMLLTQAIRWSPRLAYSTGGALQLARILIPERVRKLLRRHAPQTSVLRANSTS